MKLLKKLHTIIPILSARYPQARPYAATVNACESWITYTDGFKLVRIPNTTDLRGCYSKDQINKYLVAQLDQHTDGINYPDTERVCPNESKLTFKIDVNAKFLIDILRVLMVHKTVRLHINPNDSEGPIKLTAGGSEGVLVPVKGE